MNNISKKKGEEASLQTPEHMWVGTDHQQPLDVHGLGVCAGERIQKLYLMDLRTGGL